MAKPIVQRFGNEGSAVKQVEPRAAARTWSGGQHVAGAPE